MLERYHKTYRAELLDLTDTAAIHEVLERSFSELGRIDVIISNAGYGLFGAAEELSDEQVEHIVATNLIGPIQLIRAALPHLRAQGGGRVIQISSYGGRSPLRATHCTTRPSGASKASWSRFPRRLRLSVSA